MALPWRSATDVDIDRPPTLEPVLAGPQRAMPLRPGVTRSLGRAGRDRYRYQLALPLPPPRPVRAGQLH